MSADVTRAERILGLVLALSNKERGLTKEQIYELVPGYTNGNEETIEKRFTRDKDDLRELGFDLEIRTGYHNDQKYVLVKQEHDLTASLTPQERMLTQAAANLWSGSEEPEFHARLRATFSSTVDSQSQPQPPSSELKGTRAVATIARAIAENKPVTFAYLKTASSKQEIRTIEPWYLFIETGNLYVRGFDRERGAERLFRLSRIIPDKKLEILDDEFIHPVPQGERLGLDHLEPVLAIKSDSAALLRQHSHALEHAKNRLPEGWDLMQGNSAPFSEWADRVLAEIENVVVLEPAAFCDFIDARIDALAGEETIG